MCITYVAPMRTTVTLPDGTYRRICEIAQANQESVSHTLVVLAQRGLASMSRSAELREDPMTGFPLLDLGETAAPISVEFVDSMIDPDGE